MKKIVIAHLYPRDMNIYGDMGNIMVLSKRLEWRGYQVEVSPVEDGVSFDFAKCDIVFGGGGQDSGQLVMADDLVRRGDDLRQLAVDGAPMLVICGTYQLFGHGFTTMDGKELPGINVFRARTVAGHVRMIGNITVDTDFGRMVGFENHSGQTLLEEGQLPLGVVRKGFGNDPESKMEGAVAGNVIGTYMHGPVLPKNPALADHLILTALQRRYSVDSLQPLDNGLEVAAARAAEGRAQ